MSDASGLLLSSRASSPAPDDRKAGTKRKIPERSERRVKLRDEDSVAKLLFHPWEKSPLTDLQPMDLWNHAKEGDDWVAYHTELAATESSGGCYRVGVGLSRCAGIIKKSIGEFRTSNIKNIIKEELWAQVDADVKALEDALEVLDFGKGSQAGASARVSLKSLRRGSAPEGVQHTEEAMKEAAKMLHDWLSKPGTPLRAMLSILAGGGLFFAAHAAEKTLRGWVASGATREVAAAAAIARGTGTNGGRAVAAAGDSDAAGLELL